MNWKIIDRDSTDDLGQRVAAHLTQLLDAPSGGLIALAGGSSPAVVYEHLCNDKTFAYRAQGGKYLFVPGDERSVPSTDPESNSGMIYKSLIIPCGLESQWQEISVNSAAPEQVAQEVTRSVAERLGTQEFNAPKVVLLGMGDDGHTASLFPNSTCLNETCTGFCATHVAQKDTWRISLTPQSILDAEEVILLVVGANKANAWKQAQSPGDLKEIPTRLLHQRTNPTTVYVNTNA